MKTLCIRSVVDFKEGEVYDYQICDNTIEVNSFSNINTGNPVWTTFYNYGHFRNQHEYFSHKLYQRKQKLERICNENFVY